ncbi:CaiB/BaiF CoA transferase family protein [Actinomadura sp. CNU-125]|uniref:CaiB/BaiF CoA transferase family protein n=1 Tax=Actinomadura sp. CNU-125 TaxID=1904961 RepID=UPI000ACBEDEB|nr:CoA transferase [Actinomadura sp. CNU-125]
MTGPLEGVWVLEVSMYGFVPSAGAVLAEWGAEMIKIEHAVRGDPQRGLRQIGTIKVEGLPNPNVDHANRGKRSVGLDISVPAGRELLLELAEHADVFLTSFLPPHRRRFGIDVDDVRAVNPRIVYARGSGMGPRGQEADKGGYDMTAFWCRAAVSASITPPGNAGVVPPPGPAFGDTVSGTNLAGGIAAALFKRKETGESSVVDVSLLSSGVWAMGHGIGLSLHVGEPLVAPPFGSHGSLANPLSGMYRTADDRHIAFTMLQPGKFWADVCRHIDRPELADDPRFADAPKISENTEAAVEILRDAISARTLAEWTAKFATLAGPWAPVQDTLQVGDDAQVRANEYLIRAGELELAANPVQFDVTAPEPGAAPEFAPTPRRSSSNSVWTGNGSSRSRKPVRSPDRTGALRSESRIRAARSHAARIRATAASPRNPSTCRSARRAPPNVRGEVPAAYNADCGPW